MAELVALKERKFAASECCLDLDMDLSFAEEMRVRQAYAYKAMEYSFLLLMDSVSTFADVTYL